MEASSHMAFIAAAYAAGGTVVAGLSLWVTLDYYAQLRKLADLEKRGVTRRSAAARAQPVMEKEKQA